MEVLGKIGNFYIVLLFGLLIAGVGVLSFNFSKKIWIGTEGLFERNGGKSMNKWIKMTVASFAGLLIASFALGLTGSAGAGTGLSSASSQDQSLHHPGGRQNGNGIQPANMTGYNQGMNYTTMDAQIYMLQNQMLYLQQQLAYMMQLYNRQGSNSGAMSMPGYMNQMNNIGNNNMNNYPQHRYQ